ncbi:hypothetical protein quinque_015989 [Culex quinquefasciatus]
MDPSFLPSTRSGLDHPQTGQLGHSRNPGKKTSGRYRLTGILDPDHLLDAITEKTASTHCLTVERCGQRRTSRATSSTRRSSRRGVLGLTWCPKDFDLVASCGKDNKIHCWNQNSEEQNGEILSELATTNQWNFDVAWCPRNPALIAGSS